MPVYKTPLDLADNLLALNRENRRNTLNKRINYKGNYENSITGGSHALNNQAALHDTNATANTMTIADPNGIGADWTLPGIKENIEGLNNRYENRDGKNILYSANSKRGRRLVDLYFRRGAGRVLKNPNDAAESLLPFDDDEVLEQIKKYEGRK